MTTSDIIINHFNKGKDPELCAKRIFKKNNHFYFQAFQDDIIKSVSKKGEIAKAYAKDVLRCVIDICRQELV